MIDIWDEQKVIKTIKKKNFTIEFVQQKNLSNDLGEFYRALAEIIYKDYEWQEKLIIDGKLNKNSLKKE